jgi:hypothetical protein
MDGHVAKPIDIDQLAQTLSVVAAEGAAAHERVAAREGAAVAQLA